MYLTEEQQEIGKINFLDTLGHVRGEFLKKSLSEEKIGPYYFGHGLVDKPVKAGIVGTGNEGCGALIGQSPTWALEFVAYHDIRPSQIDRGRKVFKRAYGNEAGENVKFYDTYDAMLEDKDIEAIVIATPLWTHAPMAIKAMKAGKHVLCEKLIARTIAEAKEMCRVAKESNVKLSVGHQRHYSTLYDNVLEVIASGVLGDIRHIRALWHRNNTWIYPQTADDATLRGTLKDGWAPEIPSDDRDINLSGIWPAPYKSVEELVRWRLYDRTGGGLMAELGSHQLDAAGLFLAKLAGKSEHVHPKRVLATGGKHFYTDDRECEDHVYCMYEMPGNVTLTYSSINTSALFGYGEIITGTKGSLWVLNEQDVMLFKERAPRGSGVSAMGNPAPAEEMYTRLGHEDDWRLQLEQSKPAGNQNKELISQLKGRIEADNAEHRNQMLYYTGNLSLTPEAALAKVALEHAAWFVPIAGRPGINRGYREEMEAFAFSVRNPDFTVRCDGEVATADAVMALTTNVAIRQKRPLTFQDGWYDINSPEVPDGDVVRQLAGK